MFCYLQTILSEIVYKAGIILRVLSLKENNKDAAVDKLLQQTKSLFEYIFIQIIKVATFMFSSRDAL
jgi:hypothetical protein